MVEDDAELIKRHATAIEQQRRAGWEEGAGNIAALVRAVRAALWPAEQSSVWFQDMLSEWLPEKDDRQLWAAFQSTMRTDHYHSGWDYTKALLLSQHNIVLGSISFDQSTDNNTFYTTLSSIVALHYLPIRTAISSAVADCLLALPIELVDEICEYILPVRCSTVQTPEERARCLVETVVFAERHAVNARMIKLHSTLLDRYLRYRQRAAVAFDELLQKQHKDAKTAVVVRPSRAVRRYKTGTTTAQSTYERMEYHFFGFVRTGRHTWECNVEGAQLPNSKMMATPTSSSSHHQPSVQRKVKMRQLDIDTRPWCLMCFSPNVVLTIDHWPIDAPKPPKISYWRHAQRFEIGCANSSVVAADGRRTMPVDGDMIDVTRCLYPPDPGPPKDSL